MANKYILEFTPDAFRQNFRNLLEDLEGIATSLAGAVLLAGRSGGQQVAGGTAASEDLTLTSTAHATKDRVFLGSAQTSAYDEVNDRLGIGVAAPSQKLDVRSATSAALLAQVWNTSNGTAADARVSVMADVARIQTIAYSSGFTGFALFGQQASWSFLVATAGSGMGVGTTGATPLILGTNNTEGMQLDSNRNVVIGTAALATNATDGFLYIPSCAGTPTGTPTTKTGRIPLVYDTTNNKLYAYNGAWKSVTLA